MKSHLKMYTHPVCCAENIVQGENYRITVLTDSLIRLEYSPDGLFEDHATQVVMNRDFSKVPFTIKETGDRLTIRTEHLLLSYDKKEFTGQGLSCECIGFTKDSVSCGVWHYGDQIQELKGTARTLDGVNGKCELEPGILSFYGFTVLDDSASLILNEEGWVQPRKKGIQDLYFFGYGHEYLRALKDFYHLCGKTPMLPRFALGNWWSRYHKYTEDSYMELMEQFDREGLPFTVAVIDMDWHLVDIDPKYGSGWTGYTWNRELFPEPERFLKKLHERGMRTTLNVHPADGIRAYEECYPEMAKAMGMNPEEGEPVYFDIADPGFVENYLEKVNHPLEEKGVDFWWLDWQQGTTTKMEGLDPLWMLNHFHYLDNGRNGKRPMTFSRYAGSGSHRYPIGFSGDTIVTWESLQFQPYFTATASNIGYGWWSHDIGGHMQGYRDDEMEARWYQYGTFSPINRLHSSNSPFMGKEPWRYRSEVHEVMNEFLRMRHQMIPYLYTMNYRAWKEDQPLVWPMYYAYPEETAAYMVPNQYLFGSELMVVPVTTKLIQGINRAKTTVWIPEGIWFDFFEGTRYRGGRKLDMYRSLQTLPVLAKAGAIIPMTDCISAVEAGTNPEQLTVRVYAGADNHFVLYEDDNISQKYKKDDCVKTLMTLAWTEKKVFTIHPAEGNIALIPAVRNYRIELCGSTASEAEVLLNGEKKEMPVIWDKATSRLTISIENVRVEDTVEIILPDAAGLSDNPVADRIFQFLDQAEIEFYLKETLYDQMKKALTDLKAWVEGLQTMDIFEDLKGAILEIVTAS